MRELENFLKMEVLNFIILYLVNERDISSYEIREVLREKSKGYFDIASEYLYSALHSLEAEGLIKNYWDIDTLDEVLPKKYYKITDKGKEKVNKQLNEFKFFLEGVSSILFK